MTAIQPPRWDSDRLETDRQAAMAVFREERLQEPLEQYLEAFDEYRGAVEDLLEATVDLTKVEDAQLEVLTDPSLLRALRYLAGPPISEGDLKTLAEASLAPTKLRSDADMAKRVIETVLVALDRRRFSWVVEEREPDEAERAAATLASAALMANQRTATLRRNEGKDRQEEAVRNALASAELKQVPTRNIKTLADAPGTGEFCRECHFGSRKADFVIGLWDGRKMPLECKVTNTEVNSVKRLNNDAAAKAVAWVREFGTVQTVPAAMLSGVFKRQNLEQAQDAQLTLFWAHDLEAFTSWVESTRPASS